MARVPALLVVLLVSLLGVSPLAPSVAAQPATPLASPVASPAALSIVARGLTNPRGFRWQPDGTLLVAEAGSAGSVVGAVNGTPTPFVGGTTAAVVAIRAGCPVPFVANLPSTEFTQVGWIWGAMDLATLDGQGYLLEGGGGPIHGNPDQPSGVYRLGTDGAVRLVADLGTWVNSHPVAHTPPEGAPNGGSFYAMAAGAGALWVTDAVNGQVVRVTPDGAVTRVVDLSEGHPVPTGIALGPDGALYVGMLTAAPFPNGAAKVVKITAAGAVRDAWTGLTAVTDVALGPDGTLYAVELATGTSPTDLLPAQSGQIVRQSGPNHSEPVATGLDHPVRFGFGPDGALYVDGPAFGAEHGEGWLARLAPGGMATPAAPMACPGMATPAA